MWGQSKQASAAVMAVVYITIGALVDVWCVIWYIYLKRHDASDNTFLMCHGFFFSGLVLMGIGFALGRIGKAARQAEVPPIPQVVVPPVVTAPAVPAPANGAVQPVVTAPAVTAPPAPIAPPAPAAPL